MPIVTSVIDGHLYGIVSVNALEGVDPSRVRKSPADFEGEHADERLARRQRNWIYDVRFAEAAPG